MPKNDDEHEEINYSDVDNQSYNEEEPEESEEEPEEESEESDEEDEESETESENESENSENENENINSIASSQRGGKKQKGSDSETSITRPKKKKKQKCGIKKSDLPPKPPIPTLLSNENRQSQPYFTNFEITKLIGFRAEQLQSEAEPLVKNCNLDNPILVAIDELLQNKIPMILTRRLPNNYIEKWHTSELTLHDKMKKDLINKKHYLREQHEKQSQIL